MRRTTSLLAWLALCASLAAPARAASSARLHVAFLPKRLGEETTVEFNAQIVGSHARIPPPLTELDVRYPNQLGVFVGNLGAATCSRKKLEAAGPEGCPADSHMGEGSALAEIPIGPEVIRETARVAILRAPEHEGHIELLFYATGETPVYAQIAFTGSLLPAPPPYGAQIHIAVPLVPSLPGGPYVSVVRIHATIGPRGLTYYKHVRGKRVAYKPRGILLPDQCPRRGFPFDAIFGFFDGTSTSAYTSVPCPTSSPVSTRREPVDASDYNSPA
jgi:hypothetical protein